MRSIGLFMLYNKQSMSKKTWMSMLLIIIVTELLPLSEFINSVASDMLQDLYRSNISFSYLSALTYTVQSLLLSMIGIVISIGLFHALYSVHDTMLLTGGISRRKLMDSRIISSIIHSFLVLFLSFGVMLIATWMVGIRINYRDIILIYSKLFLSMMVINGWIFLLNVVCKNIVMTMVPIVCNTYLVMFAAESADSLIHKVLFAICPVYYLKPAEMQSSIDIVQLENAYPLLYVIAVIIVLYLVGIRKYEKVDLLKQE